MASQGPNSGATFSSVSRGVGSTVWLNTGNASASDNAYAQIVGTTNLSQYLQATNFSFSIPAGVTVNGILVEVEQKSGATGAGFESSVKIVKGGSILGTEKSTNISLSPSDTYRSYGGSADLWGLTWADTDINASTFGVGFSIGNGGKGTGSCDVDHIRITVFYTAVAAGAPVQNPLFPNPANKAFSTNLRTFLNPAETQLIGQDSFFAASGQPTIRFPPTPNTRYFPMQLRTFINPAETQLFGRDKFFGDAGEPPVSRWVIPIGRPLNVSLRTFINQMVRVSATAYTQSLSALLSFSSDAGKQANKPIAGSLTSGSVIARAVAKSLAAGLTSSANLAYLAGKFLTAGIPSTANLAHATAKALSSSLTSSSVISKAAAKSNAGSITSSSAVQKAINKLVSGSGSLIGSLTITRILFLLSSIAPSSIIAKFSNKIASGAISSTSAIGFVRTLFMTLFATITPVGVAQKLLSKLFAGVISFESTVQKAIGKFFSGAIDFIGEVISLALGRRFKLDVTCSSFAVTTIEFGEQSATSCFHSASTSTRLSFAESSATRLTIAARRLTSAELEESVFA